MAVRQLLPQMMVGPTWLRRAIVDILPFPSVKKMREIIRVMDTTSKEVLRAKRAALDAGDEALAKQVGDGKDIMSILRSYPLRYHGYVRLI